MTPWSFNSADTGPGPNSGSYGEVPRLPTRGGSGSQGSGSTESSGAASGHGSTPPARRSPGTRLRAAPEASFSLGSEARDANTSTARYRSGAPDHRVRAI